MQKMSDKYKREKEGRKNILQQKPGTVAKIICYFDDSKKKHEDRNFEKIKMLAQPPPSPTELTSTRPGPEMALHVTVGWAIKSTFLKFSL